MRKPIIIANWKMNTNLADALILAESIKNGTEGLENIEIVLCPPFVWLYPVREKIEKILGKRLSLGAQDVFWHDEGAYTGEISGAMIKSLCDYVIIGHSERKKYLHEDSEMINDKIHAALRNGLKPVVCIGEQKKRTEIKKGRGRPDADSKKNDITYQLKEYFEKITKKQMENVVIAYEPVWAIGTGHAATGVYASSIISQIREKLYHIFDWETANRTRILYGGSVDSNNIQEYIRQPEIDGVLAGGASLKAKEFIKICKEATL